jgi:hypothetical protein
MVAGCWAPAADSPNLPLGRSEPYFEKPFKIEVSNTGPVTITVMAKHINLREFRGDVPANSSQELQLGFVDGRSGDPRQNRVLVLLTAETSDGQLVLCDRYFIGQLELAGSKLEIGATPVQCDYYAQQFLNGRP